MSATDKDKVQDLIATMRGMSGLDFLRAILAGKVPAPICDLVGFYLTEADYGYAVVSGVPGPEHYNPIGTVHGGFTALLLDSTMSSAVHSTLEPGFGYTTLEYKINMVRPMTARTGRVRAVGKIVNKGKRIGTAEGQLLDEDGKLYAHGTSTCMIFEI